MKVKTRIRIPIVDEVTLNNVCKELSSMGINSRWFYDNNKEGLPAYLEMNVPGSNDGSIELLKLKKYIF